jgi:pimeloyl-ACP methyl ester carboxylesterase
MAHGATALRKRMRMARSGSQLTSTPSILACVVLTRTDLMWLVHPILVAVAIYVAVISAMYFAQTWLLFPTALVQAGHVRLPASTQRLEVETPGGDRVLGVRIPASSSTRPGGPLLLGFGGNAWSADAMALYLHERLPDCEVVAFHYRGYRPSTGQPSAEALLADAVTVFDHVQQVLAPERVVAVGFSIGAGVAAYLAQQRPLAGLVLVTPFDSLEALARDLYWWAPVGLLLRHRMPVIDFVRDLPTPTALIVAGRDTIVPARRSAPLRDVIPNLVLDRTIDAGHNDLYDRKSFVESLREALTNITDLHPRTRPRVGR